MLDIALRVDVPSVRRDDGAEDFATVRRMAHSTLKRDTTVKLMINNNRLRAGWNHADLLRRLPQLTPPHID